MPVKLVVGVGAYVVAGVLSKLATYVGENNAENVGEEDVCSPRPGGTLPCAPTVLDSPPNIPDRDRDPDADPDPDPDPESGNDPIPIHEPDVHAGVGTQSTSGTPKSVFARACVRIGS